MIGGMGFIRSYDWHSNTFLGSLVSPSGYIALGATPPTSGAVRIDAASYGDVVLGAVNATVAARFLVAATGANIGTTSAHAFNLRANTQDKWSVLADGAGTSSFASLTGTARIVGGSTNGLAIRNSANTRDNLSVNDAGTTLAIAGSSYTASISSTAGSGELPAGWAIQASSVGSGLFVCTQGTTGSKTGLQYYNQTQRYSAIEVADVAAGFSTLALMKSGGSVTVGGTINITGTTTLTGNVGIGTAVLATTGLNVRPTTLAGATQVGITCSPTFSSTAISDAEGISVSVKTAAAAFNMNAGYAIYVTVPTVGAGSTIGTINGVFVGNQGAAGVTNAYGIYIAAQSGAATTNIGLYNAGTSTLVGNVSMSGNFNVTGAATTQSAGVLSIGGTQQTTVGAAGGASALPATPTGYIKCYIGATQVVIPYYAQA